MLHQAIRGGERLYESNRGEKRAMSRKVAHVHTQRTDAHPAEKMSSEIDRRRSKEPPEQRGSQAT